MTCDQSQEAKDWLYKNCWANIGYLVLEYLIPSAQHLGTLHQDTWYEDLFCQQDADGDIRDPLEFWIVSGQFGYRLREKGELVTEDLGNIWVWGRETSGQSIILDTVFQDIWAEVKPSH